MGDLVTRDVDYIHDETRMIGYLCAPEGATRAPGVLLIHDAFGLGEDMIAIAHRLAALGFPVFAADVWGERQQPTAEPEIGPLIGSMVSDRQRWMGRLTAAHEALAAQPEMDGEQVIALGYCFGGSSALEYARTVGRLRGVVSIHGGLDLIGFDWSAAPATPRVLVCTGADDPMATGEMRAELQSALTQVDIDWEVDLYSHTRHAFTSPKAQFSPMPDVVAYNPRSAARAWAATTRFLHELHPDRSPDSSHHPTTA